MSAFVVVRHGKKVEKQHLEDVAGKFLDYAILSSNIYCNDEDDPNFIPLKEWQRIHLNLVPKLPIPTLKSQKMIEGLKYEIWLHTTSEKYQVAIVFKGTTPSLFSDWVCNLRWITLNPLLRGVFYKFLWDYYHQVQTLTPIIIEQVKEKLGDMPVEFITTGHSLGGGLAQQAAYSCKDIKKVIVFNSTPVTGYMDINQKERVINHMGIETSRVFHSGEVLSYLRDFIRIFIIPLSIANPCIKEYQFSFLKGSVIKKHSIQEFALYLVNASQVK